MQVIVSGKGVELTTAIQDYVDKKLGGLEKFFKPIMRLSVTVGMETKHHVQGEVFYAEAKVEVTGNDVFAKETSKDLYSAVDLLKNVLEAELKKHKVKLQGNAKKKKQAARAAKEYQAE